MNQRHQQLLDERGLNLVTDYKTHKDGSFTIRFELSSKEDSTARELSITSKVVRMEMARPGSSGVSKAMNNFISSIILDTILFKEDEIKRAEASERAEAEKLARHNEAERRRALRTTNIETTGGVSEVNIPQSESPAQEPIIHDGPGKGDSESGVEGEPGSGE